MRRLTPLDSLFLMLERRHQPLHVGALMLYELPEGAGPNFVAELAERLRRSTQAASPFNRRLENKVGVRYWADDNHFDIAHHFVHLALPSPGRIRELLTMASRVHSAHLDRAYPLWRTYLIEGLEDGRIATYSKIHHALVDGVAGMRLMMKSMSPDMAQSMQMPPPWEVKTRKSRQSALPIPNPSASSMDAMRALAGEGVRAFPGLAKAFKDTWADLRHKHPDLVHSVQAPRCILNQKITGSRRFAAQSYATARIKGVAKRFGATANDVIMGMVGGALRAYLGELNELPDRPLVAAVPVSLRRDDSESGNQVAFALSSLATDVDDAARRLQVIKNCMDYNKARLSQLSPGQIAAFGAAFLMPGVLSMVSGMGRNTAFNTVISHVPGPRRDLYWQGCKLTGMYPVSIVTDGIALNFTLISRHDFVDFGLIACRKTLPHVQRLLEHLENELAALEKAA